MAKRRKHRNASLGSVNNIILRTLANGDKYGYEIIKEVEEYSDGKIKLKQPSLYSSLTRFEDKGLVTSYWGDSDIGGRRHYYHLTENGYTYYRIHVLKESTDNNSDEDDEILDEEQFIPYIVPNAHTRKCRDMNKNGIMQLIGRLRTLGVYQTLTDCMICSILEQCDEDCSYRAYLGKPLDDDAWSELKRLKEIFMEPTV